MEGHFLKSEVFKIHNAYIKLPFPNPKKWPSLERLMSKKSAQRKERALVLMLVGMLCVLLIFFGGLVLKTNRQFQNFKERENRIEARLIQARKEFAQKEAYLARFLEDPEFLERVVRERLGYARPDELLFRFSDEP
ncbi:MAG: hypothetical protein EA353_01680 [Puniceicoccaceae bacterium]|nr:MAG: hypothetical protein EA353_01680 [Puniceicoccaceae bacterium]